MDNRYTNIHYFIFREGHELFGHYIKMIGGTETQSKKAFKFLFGYDSKPQKEKVLENCPMGCYREFYPPLPEMISFADDGEKIFQDGNENEHYKTYGWVWADFVGDSSSDYRKTEIAHKKSISKIENRKDFVKMKNYRKK